MLVEKIIFIVLALYLLITMFFKLLKKIDKVYAFILVLQLVGLLLELIEIIFKLNFNIFIKIIMYFISVVIPILIIIMEHKGKNLSELVYMTFAKFYEFTR